MLMCGPHWRRVPRTLQDLVWSTWRALKLAGGPLKAPQPVLDAYMAARDHARDAVAAAPGDGAVR
jgi:hypothetical protein